MIQQAANFASRRVKLPENKKKQKFRGKLKDYVNFNIRFQNMKKPVLK